MSVSLSQAVNSNGNSKFVFNKLIIGNDDPDSELVNNSETNEPIDKLVARCSLWSESEEAEVLFRQHVQRISEVNETGSYLSQEIDHRISRNDEYSEFFSSLKVYVNNLFKPMDTFRGMDINQLKDICRDYIDHINQRELPERLKDVVPNEMKSGLEVISKWKIRSLITNATEDVYNAVPGFSGKLISIADLVMLHKSGVKGIGLLASKLSMSNEFNLFKGAKCFDDTSNKSKHYFLTSLTYCRDNEMIRVAIQINVSNPGLSHYIKLFISFVLRMFPDVFSDLEIIMFEEQKYIVVPLDRITKLFLTAVSGFKGLLNGCGAVMGDFYMPKGKLCYFLTAILDSKNIVISYDSKTLEGRFGLLISGSFVVEKIVTPCLHCIDPEMTCSEFMFCPDVSDPVVLGTNALYADSNNPPVWFIDHDGPRDIESPWVKSLLFANNYSKTSIKINDTLRSKDDEMLHTYNLNIFYPTHHEMDDSVSDEHAHIRLSLCYLLNVDGYTLMMPGHMFYTFDSIINWIKDMFHNQRSVKNQSNFFSQRTLLIKRIKTNLSYISLPDSGMAIFTCYKIYIILHWLTTMDDFSVILALIHRCFRKNTLTIAGDSIPLNIDVDGGKDIFNKMLSAHESGKLRSYISDMILKIITCNIDGNALKLNVFKAIYNIKDELCYCSICKSLGFCIDEDSIGMVAEILNLQILYLHTESASKQCAILGDVITQASNISSIVEATNIKDSSTFVKNDITVVGIMSSGQVCHMAGFYTTNSEDRARLNILKHRYLSDKVADELLELGKIIHDRKVQLVKIDAVLVSNDTTEVATNNSKKPKTYKKRFINRYAPGYDQDNVNSRKTNINLSRGGNSNSYANQSNRRGKGRGNFNGNRYSKGRGSTRGGRGRGESYSSRDTEDSKVNSSHYYMNNGNNGVSKSASRYTNKGQIYTNKNNKVNNDIRNSNNNTKVKTSSVSMADHSHLVSMLGFQINGGVFNNHKN